MAKIRKNGFEYPWNYQQILSNLAYIIDILIFILIVFPSYSFKQKVLIGTIVLISLSILITFDILLTLSNPSDTLVEAYLNSDDYK